VDMVDGVCLNFALLAFLLLHGYTLKNLSVLLGVLGVLAVKKNRLCPGRLPCSVKTHQ